LLTLQEQLKKQEMLDAVGGAPYLVQLTDAVASAANAEHYAKRVEEKAILRRLIEASEKIRQMAHGDFDEVTEVVDKAEQTVFAVAHRRSTAYFTPMRALIGTVYEQLEYRSEHQEATTGLPTAFTRLDEMTAGLQDSDLVIVAARPSMGKTSLAMGIAQHCALRCGKPAAVFSLEMSKEQLCVRMICSEARVDAHHLRTGYLDPERWRRVGTSLRHNWRRRPSSSHASPDCSRTGTCRGKCRRLMAEQKS